DALNHVKDEIDGTLCFRQSCRAAICGSCALRVNKRSCLACRTRITPSMAAEVIVIDPLSHFHVIRDLVVDMEPFYERLRQVQPYLVRDNTSPATSEGVRMDPLALAESKAMRDCILCGACYSDCNVLDVESSFLGPAAIVSALRFAKDPRDINTGRAAQAIELGLYKCPVDQECEFACPKDIRIRREGIERLREMAVRGGHGPMAEHKRLINSVITTGGVVCVTSKPATELYPEYIKEFEGDPQAEIVLFLGCIINRRKQSVARAIINIMQANRVAVHLPRRALCCGSPFMRIGQRPSIKPFVENNFTIFNRYAEQGIKHVLTSCSGCNSTFRHDFPTLAKEFGIPMEFGVFDVGEYMVRRMQLNTKDLRHLGIKGMYHYPCHIKASGLEEEIYIDLMHRMPGVELVKVPRSGYCCGGGGGVRAAFPSLADKLALRRIEIAQESGVDTLITNCPFCVMSFERVLAQKEKAGERIDFRIIDFYEMFSEAYGMPVTCEPS
ncbi:MAG: heterodisulfide reductase-related iron-sulfur binding cluster, partial [Methanomassiliicoccales archaeon]|nr:heterodisulfide reductase-related iron-sulfur binding cluster [Methanomassiliicoccales archaeon]